VKLHALQKYKDQLNIRQQGWLPGCCNEYRSFDVYQTENCFQFARQSAFLQTHVQVPVIRDALLQLL
jgi:hypothetical protein